MPLRIVVQIQLWKQVPDHAGFAAPTWQHELNHTRYRSSRSGIYPSVVDYLGREEIIQ